MKPIAAFVLVAVFSLSTGAALAKTVSAPQSDSDRMTSTLAGPAKSKPADTSTAQPSKKTLKKAKVAPKPAMQDPN